MTGRGGEGVGLGLIATFLWALYNVGTSIGRADGFSSIDLAMLRFGSAAILLFPLLVIRFGAVKRIGVFRLCLLTVLIGPLFPLLLNTGYGIAPLAHGVAIPAAATMLTATTLATVINRSPLRANRVMGIGLLICGLVIIASNQSSRQAQSEIPVWIGDLFFAASGVVWGTFTWLVGRWRLPALETTAAVSATSACLFLPVYLTFFGATSLPAALWFEQVIYQGLFGGALAIMAFGACVLRVGPGAAALFPALVPPAAILISIPLTGTIPTVGECLGIGLSTLGLIVALDFTTRYLDRLGARSRQPSGE